MDPAEQQVPLFSEQLEDPPIGPSEAPHDFNVEHLGDEIQRATLEGSSSSSSSLSSSSSSSLSSSSSSNSGNQAFRPNQSFNLDVSGISGINASNKRKRTENLIKQVIATFETNKDWNNLILTLEKLNWDDFEDGYTVVANLAARLNKDSILEIYPQDTMKEYIVRLRNMYFVETIVENENWRAFKIDPREKLRPQYQNYLARWIHANRGSADACALDFTNLISNSTLSNRWALFIEAEAVVARQQGQTFGNDQMKLCLTKFDNQTFVSTGLYALNPKGREYNEVLEKLLKEQKESKGYARQCEPYQSRSCYACSSQDHIMRSCPVLAKAKTIRPNEKIYKRTRSALANKQCAYHGWGTHVSKECYAIKKAKEILENGKRNNDSNSPPVQVNTLKNKQLREELNEMKAQMALILEKMPNQQSNA